MLVHELSMARFTLGLSLLSLALTTFSITATSAEISLVKDDPSLAPVSFSNLHRRTSRKHGESKVVDVVDIKVTEKSSSSRHHKTIRKSSSHRSSNKHKSSRKGHGSNSVSRKCRARKHKIVHKASSRKCRTRKSSRKHGSSHKKSSKKTHRKKCRKGSKQNGGSKKSESTKHSSSSSALDKCNSLLKSKNISQKEWETFSECRCTASNLRPKNRRGIAICYQVGWFDRRKGMFGGEILIYKKGGDKGGNPFNLEVQWPANPPKLTASDTKLDGSAKQGTSVFAVDPSSKDGIINRFHFSGQLSKSQMQKAQLGRRADVTSQEDMISPATYQLTASGEDSIALQRGQDWSNLPLGNNVPAKPFGDFAKLTSDATPNAPSSPSTTTTSTASPSSTPTPAPETSSAPATTAAAPAPTNDAPAPVAASPAETTQPSANGDGQKTTGATTAGTSNNATPAADGTAPSGTVSAADSMSSSTDAPAPAGVPGQSLGVAPIGLIVFGIVMVIGVAIVAYNTWERRGYRMQFRRRNEMLQTRPTAM